MSSSHTKKEFTHDAGETAHLLRLLAHPRGTLLGRRVLHGHARVLCRTVAAAIKQRQPLATLALPFLPSVPLIMYLTAWERFMQAIRSTIRYLIRPFFTGTKSLVGPPAVMGEVVVQAPTDQPT